MVKNDRNTVQEMADRRMRGERFEQNGRVTDVVSDPIADTIIEVTLDQLKPYDHNPRQVINPKYEEIKLSIRARGLDAPPAITRRPNEHHYIIRNGGNTRLQILRELWHEKHDERFYRIKCLFRPWSARGEIVALSGHLAENDLHGGLTFIERALGVEHLRVFYEMETAEALTQRDLAKRLKADGYPVSQPHISLMSRTLQFLFPAIPKVLLGGLGRPKVEKLLAFRQAAEQVWEMRIRGGARPANSDFAELFQDVLEGFDELSGVFGFEAVQDAIIGRMSEELSVEYALLQTEILYSLPQNLDEALDEAPMPGAPPPPTREPSAATRPASVHNDAGEHNNDVRAGRDDTMASPEKPDSRLALIGNLLASNTSPVLASQSDEVPERERLRHHIAQISLEIAEEADLDNLLVEHACLPGGILERLSDACAEKIPDLVRTGRRLIDIEKHSAQTHKT